LINYFLPLFGKSKKMNGFRVFSAFLAQISQKLKIRFIRKLRTYVNFPERKIKTYINHLHPGHFILPANLHNDQHLNFDSLFHFLPDRSGRPPANWMGIKEGH